MHNISPYLVLDCLPTQGSKQNNMGKQILSDLQQRNLSGNNTSSAIEQWWQNKTVRTVKNVIAELYLNYVSYI